MKALLLALAIAIPAAALDTAELEDLFREGNDLFRRGNEVSSSSPAEAFDLYRGAALRYERILGEGGVRNGRLYYNLGNAYFQMGDIGRAIVNYLRAERFIPGDENLRQNLRYARSRRADRLETGAQAQAIQTLFFWHYDLSAGIRFNLFALGWIAFWGLAALRLWRPAAISIVPAGVAGALATLMLGSLLVDSYGSAGDRYGVVTSLQTTARKGDGDSYEPAFTEPLHAGAEFRLLDQRAGWLQIELPDKRTAWIRERDAERVDAEP